MPVSCMSNLKSSVSGMSDIRALHPVNHIEAADIDAASKVMSEVTKRLVQLELPFKAERVARWLEFKANTPECFYNNDGFLQTDIRYTLFKPVNFNINDIHGLFTAMQESFSRVSGGLYDLPTAEMFKASVLDTFRKRLNSINAEFSETGNIIATTPTIVMKFNNYSYNSLIDLEVILSDVRVVKIKR